VPLGRGARDRANQAEGKNAAESHDV
jgi:hypothetical protein